jgi:GT2 family glycosyltransferase/glycosyltransferase involved in cell wall biosynthesis
MARVSRRKRAGSANPAPATEGGRRAGGKRAARSESAAPPEPAAEAAAPNGEAQAPPVPLLHGFIDEAHRARISGWIWDPQRPDERIELELLDDNRPLMRVVARDYRSDLREAGIGDGQYAFAIPLSEAMLPEARHVLHLRCAATGAELPGSPIVLERRQPAAPASREFYEPMAPYLPAHPDGEFFALPDAGLEGEVSGLAEADAAPAAFDDLLPATPLDAGEALQSVFDRPAGEATAPQPGDVLQCHIDSADWTGIAGWIWDPRQPEARIAVELFDGDTALATISAGEYRHDLEQAGIGDGRHGFSVAFGEALLPHARHVLHLRPVGSAVDLPSFPLVLTRDNTGIDATVQFILGNLMTEAERAEKAADLEPIIGGLVRLLDGAVARYYDLAEEGDADAGDLINPRELAPQFQSVVKSLQVSYPVLHNDGDGPPLVSIVIPVFNKFELTYNCVKSIIEQGARAPFEIIVVDDCSRDETLLASFAFGRGIRLIRSATNAGFIRSCNRGFDAAQGEYVVFLNNDTEVKPHWLDALSDTLDADPAIGIAGAKLLFPDGSLQECGGIVWRLGDAWNWGRGQPADDPRFSYLRDADYVSGAALMVRRTLFGELGKFDEYYLPAYYEDTDLCFRVRKAGWRVVVQPASEVIHFEGASAGTSVAGTGMKRYQAINCRKFFERWKTELATHRFNGELPELEAERNVRQRALFIDDSVPEPDKDAGSNAAFQHMRSLQRLGYKVTFVPGDNMARIDPYTTELQRRGIECLYHPYYFSVEDVFRKQTTQFELFYLHRYSNASKYAGMIRQRFPKARILYNVADLHFLRLQREAELAGDGERRAEAEKMRRLELGAMSFVDCVIVHSAAEAELLREIAPHVAVQVIPWTVPPRDIACAAAPTPAIAFIGGYRHTPNVDAAKWAAQSLMPALRRQVPGIELLLVGSNMPPEVSALAASDIVPLGYVPSLDGVFERVRLTVAPLRYGAGLKGKVLESLAAGIPCVMTAIAAEGIELAGELRSLVADDPETLAARIARLCQDDVEYRRIAEAGKAHVAANYSPERIDALIRQACQLD